MRSKRVTNEAVEVVAAWHCNIRCASCAFASPAHSVRFADIGTVETDLTGLAVHLEVEHVRILGGEPFLHPDFLGLVAAIRRSSIGKLVRVVTNGVTLLKIPDAYWEAVDEIHISQYPNTRRMIQNNLDEFRAKCDRFGTEIEVEECDYFRFAFREQDNDAKLTQRVYSTCQIAHLWRSLTADNGRLFRCLQSVYIQDSPEYSSLKSKDGEDYLEIANIGSAHELETWLERKPALKSCSVCAGSVGRLHDQRQLKKGEADPRLPAIEAIDPDYMAKLEEAAATDNDCVTNYIVYSGR